MKLKWMICTLAAMLVFCAHGEESKYISAQDTLYWHANSTCAGVFSMDSEDTTGYFACPVCVHEDIEPRVTAVERGGTIILKIPDEWMATRKDIGSVFGWNSNSVFSGEEAKAEIAEYLHGDDYSEFMKAWEETGTAEAKIYTPGIYPRNGELFMNQRHTGGAWYVVMRPEKVSGNSLTIYLRFFGADMKAHEDGTLTYAFNDEWGDTGYKLKFSERKNKGKAFSEDYGDFSIALYEELDTHIAVIRQKNADKDLISDVRLTIGEAEPIELKGYMDDGDAVYCCTLTDAEAHILKNGAEAQVSHVDWYTEADFRGTDYAVVEKGTGGWGVIDRDENFVLGPGYRDAERLDNVVFLTEQDKDVSVVNLDTMQTIGSFECPKGGYITTRPLNSAVYAIFISEVWYLYETETGFPLAVLPINEPDSPYYPYMMGGAIDGTYTVSQSGEPRRLVFWRENDEKGYWSWLADNAGNRVSEDHKHIEPLIWDDDRGLFAVQAYDEVISHPNNPEKYVQGYDGREFFGENWRVGLIDQDGNTVADTEYVFIKVGTDNAVELRREDGGIEIIKW